MTMTDDTERVARALRPPVKRSLIADARLSLWWYSELPGRVTRALHASGADIEAFCREMERGE